MNIVVKLIILIIVSFATLIMLLVSTIQDIKLFRDPRTRSRVLEAFPRKISDAELFRKFLKVNLREAILFLGGLLMGVLIWAAV